MTAKMGKMEAQWRAQEDARIMAEYQKIIGDKKRMGMAVREAKKTASDLTKRADAMQAVAKTRINRRGK